MGGMGFEPDPALIALIFVKRFVYLEVLLVLALIRAALAQGQSRLIALAVALIAALFIAVTFAPALGGTDLPGYRLLAQSLSSGQGMRVPLALSALFFVSALVPARSRRWIDGVHGLGLLAFLGLWGASLT